MRRYEIRLRVAVDAADLLTAQSLAHLIIDNIDALHCDENADAIITSDPVMVDEWKGD